MARQYINPETLSSTSGRYTQVIKSGNMVFIAGQVSTDAAGKVIGEGDVKAQARQVYKNLEAALKSVGGSLADVVKTTTYLTKAENFPIWSPIRAEIWTSTPPTSTLIIVSGLALPAFLIEVEAIAILGDR